MEVQLDEPLWVPRVGPQVIAMEIMALCVQLDSVILTNTRDVSHLFRTPSLLSFELVIVADYSCRERESSSVEGELLCNRNTPGISLVPKLPREGHPRY